MRLLSHDDRNSNLLERKICQVACMVWDRFGFKEARSVGIARNGKVLLNQRPSQAGFFVVWHTAVSSSRFLSTMFQKEQCGRGGGPASSAPKARKRVPWAELSALRRPGTPLSEPVNTRDPRPSPQTSVRTKLTALRSAGAQAECLMNRMLTLYRLWCNHSLGIISFNPSSNRKRYLLLHSFIINTRKLKPKCYVTRKSFHKGVQISRIEPSCLWRERK